MKNWVLSLSALVLLGAVSYGLFLATAPEAVPDGLLYANGHIEGTDVAISAEVTGTVLESRLQEGRQVAVRDLLLRLDDADFLKRLVVAEAEQASAQGGVVQSRAELAVWHHHLGSAERDLQRARSLAADRNLSEQQLRSAEDAVKEAQGNVARLASVVTQAEANLQAAAGRADLIRLQLDKTRIEAPIDGTIVTKAIEVGELATPGRVLAVLVNLSQLELRVFVPERDLGKIQLGGPAHVTVDAFPEHYFLATVTRADQRTQFTPRDIHMPEERTRMVFGITLAVENAEGILKPGMPADAWIKWRDEMDWPAKLPVPR